MDFYFGLDFGSSNTTVAIYRPNNDADPFFTFSMPSEVLFDDRSQQFYFGNEALCRAQDCLNSYIDYVKLKALTNCSGHIGSFCISDIIKKIIVKALNDAVVKFNESCYDASDFINSNACIKLTVTYPATEHCDNYRDMLAAVVNSMSDEGLQCGATIKLVGVLTEPVSSALAFLDAFKQPKKVIVFDLGGGTLDCTALQLKIDNIGRLQHEQLLPATSVSLGGKNWNEAFTEIVISKMRRLYPEDYNEFGEYFKSFTHKLEREVGKKRLTTINRAEFNPSDVVNCSVAPDRPIEITKDEFIKHTQYLTRRAVRKLKDTVSEFGRLYPNETIDRIIVVGGGSFMSEIRKGIEEFFNQNPDRFSSNDPDVSVCYFQELNAVSIGAARYSALVDLKELSNRIYGYDGRGICDEYGVFKLIDAGCSLPYVSDPVVFNPNGGNSLIRVYDYDSSYKQEPSPYVIDARYYMRGYLFNTKRGKNYSFRFLLDANNHFSIEMKNNDGELIDPAEEFGRK